MLNPRTWLAAVLLVVVAFAGGNWHGAREAKKVAVAAEKAHTAAALAKQTEENEKVLAKERRLRSDDAKAYATFYQHQEQQHAEKDRVITDLRRDVVRLRIPVRTNPSYQAQADAGRPAAAGTGEEGHAELSQDAAIFLVGLLARGDDAITKHAEVVDRYERLRLACTTSPTP